MSSSSSTALERLEATAPASYRTGPGGWLKALAERASRRLMPRFLEAGRKLLDRRIIAAYQRVRTQHEAELAAEILLSSQTVRIWIVNFELLATKHMVQKPSFADELEQRQAWVPVAIAPRLRLLRKIAAEFNRSSSPGRVSPTLALLLYRAASPAFHLAFDDTRLPASVRLAYYSHRKIFLHLWALNLASERRGLEVELIHPLTAALQNDLRLALGLAMGMPGAEAVEDEALDDIPDVVRLEIDDEQVAWNRYLKAARTLD